MDNVFIRSNRRNNFKLNMNPEQIIHEHYKRVGAMGGKATLKKRGKKYFKELSEKAHEMKKKKAVDKSLAK